MKYEVQIKASARKSLDKILLSNSKMGNKILSAILAIEEDSNPTNLPNAKKMQGFKSRYRWRVGEYRIVGDVKKSLLIIQIIEIAPRGDTSYD